MNDTARKGITTELKCELFFIEKGFNVYCPISPDSRCDFIVEIENFLYKIQVKTSRITTNNTGICFNTYSLRTNSSLGNTKIKYSEEEIDFFMTTYNNNFYLIPIELCQGQEKTLSFQQNKNNNATILEDMQAETILNKITSEDIIEWKQSTNNKKIAQYDKNGNFLLTYNSLAEAARSLNKDPKTCCGHISQVAHNKRKTAYGYIWKFVEY